MPKVSIEFAGDVIISACDPFLLDGTSSTGISGRPWANISWSAIVVPNVLNYTWKYKDGLPNLFQYISSDVLSSGVYIFELTVTNWLGSSATKTLQ